MKVFFAVALPDDIRARLAALSRELERSAPGAPVTWVPETNFHLTLRFVGMAGDDALALCRDAAQEACEASAPFELAIEGAGSFGGKKNPRVLWVGAREDAGHQMMKTLAGSLERALVDRGFEASDHAFSAHATLARIRPHERGRFAARKRGTDAASQDRALALARLVSALESAKEFKAGTARVDGIVLFESVSRGGKSPEYRPVETFTLGTKSRAA
jgi:2'-5' RNA ligase